VEPEMVDEQAYCIMLDDHESSLCCDQPSSLQNSSGTAGLNLQRTTRIGSQA